MAGGGAPRDDDGSGTVGLNHAVLWVSDPARSSAFYQQALGMVEMASMPDMVFLKAPASPNDHDLGLFRSRGAGSAPGTTGLYHLAWEVATLRALRATRGRLVDLGALVGESDHAFTKSLYSHDPDGIEFEVLWQIPIGAPARQQTDHLPTQPLDLEAEIERYGLDTVGGWLELQSSVR